MQDIFAKLGFTEAETADLADRTGLAYREGQAVTLPTKERLGPPLNKVGRAARKLLEALDEMPPELHRAFDDAELPSGIPVRDLVMGQDATLVLRALAAALTGFQVTIRVADVKGGAPPRQRDYGTNRFILLAATAFTMKTGRKPTVVVATYKPGHPESGEFVEFLEALAVQAGVPGRGLVDKFKHLRRRGSI